MKKLDLHEEMQSNIMLYDNFLKTSRQYTMGNVAVQEVVECGVRTAHEYPLEPLGGQWAQQFQYRIMSVGEIKTRFEILDCKLGYFAPLLMVSKDHFMDRPKVDYILLKDDLK